MSLAYSEKYTIKDHSAWDGDWELVRGVVFAMSPSPLYSHQYVNGKIFRQLDEQLDNCTKCHAVIEKENGVNFPTLNSTKEQEKLH